MKKLLIFTILIAVLFVSAAPVLALEMKYPVVFGLPDLNTGKPDLAQYISYIFGIAIYLAGFVSLVSFAIGGVQYLASMDSEETKKSGADRMKGAVLGLALVLVSFMIIRTINPKLITPVITPLPELAGLALVNADGDKKPTSGQDADLSDNDGYTKLVYTCCVEEDQCIIGDDYLVWQFPNPGFESGNDDLSAVEVVELTCEEGNNTLDLSEMGSFKVEHKIPGVYYYLSQNCEGYSSYANTSSSENIQSLFSRKIKSVKIINDEENNVYYGVIFHQTAGLNKGGMCSQPIAEDEAGDGVPTNENGCADVSISAAAADIYKINTSPSVAPGDGVSFYSEAWGWKTGANAGFSDISDEDIEDPSSQLDPNTEIDFSYDYVNQPIYYQNYCVFFGDCPGSIEIRGDYLVAVYSVYSANADSYCQTFTKNVPNLAAEEIIAKGKENESLENIYIIPLMLGESPD